MRSARAGVSMMTRGMAPNGASTACASTPLRRGSSLTDMTNKLWSDPTMQNRGHANTPLRRLGQVDDLIGTAIYLASKASAFMTGQVLYVDGGMSAGTLVADRALI